VLILIQFHTFARILRPLTLGINIATIVVLFFPVIRSFFAGLKKRPAEA